MRSRKRVAWNMNAANISLDNARAYAEQEFSKAGMDLDTVLPNFDRNFLMLKNKLGKALNVPRIEMPVIEPRDIGLFNKRLQKGSIDIFKPYARGKFHAPKSVSGREGDEWVVLGFDDGHPNDDKVRGKLGSVAVKKLLPTQSQIWFDKLIQNLVKFGIPSGGSPILSQTIIVSKEGYILDGHHRFAQALLANPKLAMKALILPLDIKTLLKIGKTYGEAIGNRPKASLNRKMVASELRRAAKILLGLQMSPKRRKKLIGLKKKFQTMLDKVDGEWSTYIDNEGNLIATVTTHPSDISTVSESFKINTDTNELTHGSRKQKYKDAKAVVKAMSISYKKIKDLKESKSEPEKSKPEPKKTTRRKTRKTRKKVKKAPESGSAPATSWRHMDVPGERKTRRKKSSQITAGRVKEWLIEAAEMLADEFELDDRDFDKAQIWIMKNFRAPVAMRKVLKKAHDEEEYFENL